MAVNKTKVQAYLETGVLNALTKYADQNRLTESNAIEKLLKNVLIETDNQRAIAISPEHETRLAIVENDIERCTSVQRCLVQAIERIDEQLTVLEDNCSHVKSRCSY